MSLHCELLVHTHQGFVCKAVGFHCRQEQGYKLAQTHQVDKPNSQGIGIRVHEFARLGSETQRQTFEEMMCASADLSCVLIARIGKRSRSKYDRRGQESPESAWGACVTNRVQ
eukprot:4168773-Amphidinium_carterae.2